MNQALISLYEHLGSSPLKRSTIQPSASFASSILLLVSRRWTLSAMPTISTWEVETGETVAHWQPSNGGGFFAERTVVCTSCGGAVGSRRSRLTESWAAGICCTVLISCWSSRSTKDDQFTGNTELDTCRPLQEQSGLRCATPPPCPTCLVKYLWQQVRMFGCSAACTTLQECSCNTSCSRLTALCLTNSSQETHSASSCHTYTCTHTVTARMLRI